MPKYVTNLDDYYHLPNPGLRTYLDRVAKGQPDEYRTPFYEGKSLEEIVEMGRNLMIQSGTSKKWPTLFQFEEDLGKKVGPMSIMKPLSARMKDIDAYYELVLLDSKPILPEAIAAAQEEWSKIAGLRIRMQQRTVDEMKLSTNSGCPDFTRRKSVVHRTVPIDIQKFKDYNNPKHVDYMMGLNSGTREYLACATIGWRGQEGGPEPDDVKQRVVWMFPFGVNVKELQVYQPFKIAMQKHNLVPAWNGMDYVDVCVTKMFDTKGKDDVVVCTDFSKFDQHFNRHLQDVAKTHLKYLFRGDPYMYDWLNNIFPIKYNIPLCIAEDKILIGDHGMGSGSGGTNDDETLSHRTMQHEAAINDHQKLNKYSQCLGDDGILTYPGITVDSVMQTYTAHGLEMNPDKQYVSKHDCVYLRRWHHENYRINGVCVGVYSIERALGRLAEQERYLQFDGEGYRTYKNALVLRSLSIIENTKFHPDFEAFVELCIKGDKFRLGLDIPGFFDNIKVIAKEFNDYMPDFMGYTKAQGVNEKDPTRGIENWRVVQYLKSKQ